MAYLHLPEQHSTDDLVLAGQIAEAFESQDLFVAWTIETGAGARPTVQAVVRDAPPHPLVEALLVLRNVIAGAWRAVARPPAKPTAAPAEARQAA